MSHYDPSVSLEMSEILVRDGAVARKQRGLASTIVGVFAPSAGPEQERTPRFSDDDTFGGSVIPLGMFVIWVSITALLVLNLVKDQSALNFLALAVSLLTKRLDASGTTLSFKATVRLVLFWLALQSSVQTAVLPPMATVIFFGVVLAWYYAHSEMVFIHSLANPFVWLVAAMLVRAGLLLMLPYPKGGLLCRGLPDSAVAPFWLSEFRACCHQRTGGCLASPGLELYRDTVGANNADDDDDNNNVRNDDNSGSGGTGTDTTLCFYNSKDGTGWETPAWQATSFSTIYPVALLVIASIYGVVCLCACGSSGDGDARTCCKVPMTGLAAIIAVLAGLLPLSVVLFTCFPCAMGILPLDVWVVVGAAPAAAVAFGLLFSVAGAFRGSH